MPFYEVVDRDGNSLGRYAAMNEDELGEIIADIAPGQGYTLEDGGRQVRIGASQPNPATNGVAVLCHNCSSHYRTGEAERCPGCNRIALRTWEIRDCPACLRTDYDPNAVRCEGCNTPLPQIRGPGSPSPAIPTADENREIVTPPSSINIGGATWRIKKIVGEVTSRNGNFIYVQGMPIRGWTSGTEIGKRTINNWKTRLDTEYDEENKILVNTEEQCAFVWGHWKPKYQKVIERLLGFVGERMPTEKDLKVMTANLERQRDLALNEAQRKLTDIEGKIQGLRELLLTMSRDRDGLRIMVDNYKPVAEADAKKIMERLTKVKGVTGVAVAGENIILTTHHIYIETVIVTDGDGRMLKAKKQCKFDIGKFRISINSANGRVEFNNLTRKVNNAYHPHIPVHSGACLGEIETTIPDYISKLKFPEVATLLIRYLESVDVKDRAGMTIALWPKISEEEVKETKKETKKEMATPPAVTEPGQGFHIYRIGTLRDVTTPEVPALPNEAQNMDILEQVLEPTPAAGQNITEPPPF